jgi:hypothetical protein
VITAKWETRCGLCNRAIPKGREIALLPDRQRWGHPACVEEQESGSRSSAARAYRQATTAQAEAGSSDGERWAVIVSASLPPGPDRLRAERFRLAIGMRRVDSTARRSLPTRRSRLWGDERLPHVPPCSHRLVPEHDAAPSTAHVGAGEVRMGEQRGAVHPERSQVGGEVLHCRVRDADRQHLHRLS